MGATFTRFAEPEYIKTSVIRGWKFSCTAYTSDYGYVWQEIGNSTICLAFSGSLRSRTLLPQRDHKFGACHINEHVDCFQSMELALVSSEVLTTFSYVWNDKLKTKVEEALRTGRTVMFTGHSFGGGVATLATLSILEKFGKDAAVFATTFGFPLIGDEVLAMAVRRQGWDNHFFNVVSSGDVFARTLLAPRESVCTHLEFLLPHWQKLMEQINEHDTDIFMEPQEWGFPDYLSTVLQDAQKVIKFLSFTKMEAAKKLVRILVEGAVELSPYRPFAYYLFCSSKGALLVEDNEADVALPILYDSLASARDEASISDHVNYGRVIHQKTNIISLERHPILPPSQGEPISAMAFILDFLGFGDGRLHANQNFVNLEERSAATEVQLATPGVRIQENTFRFEESMTNNPNLCNHTTRRSQNHKRLNPIDEETQEPKKKLKGKMIE